MDNKYKNKWELFVAFLLVFVCVFIPLRLALNLDIHGVDESGEELYFAFTPWEYFFYICDVLFLVDLIL